jgi:DNA polymerase III alpha subunit (gram-positive type)
MLSSHQSRHFSIKSVLELDFWANNNNHNKQTNKKQQQQQANKDEQTNKKQQPQQANKDEQTNKKQHYFSKTTCSIIPLKNSRLIRSCWVHIKVDIFQLNQC